MFSNLSTHEIVNVGHLIAQEIYCNCPEEAHVYEALAKQIYISLENLEKADKCKCHKSCKCHR
ncbi:hypothetical protein [uncultured Clostridium sp.]|uniref:hypothetical protein n=1 Tax=uncultured Clostridium sp. TaxID=59620 RepID=UPI0026081044|nr:hypothetical protein [uncultured Clostridium sp.]